MVSPLTVLRSHFVDETSVRMETWALGGRYGGEVLLGAQSELNEPGLPPHRAAVLLSIIRAQRRARAAARRRRPQETGI